MANAVNDNLPAPAFTAWVLFVPVYMTWNDGEPDVWARFAWMEWLLGVAFDLQGVVLQFLPEGHGYWFWRVRAIA